MKLQSPVVLVLALVVCAANLAVAQDWMIEARRAIERGDLPAARSSVEKRMAEEPADWEALGWHARIIARQGEWAAAEFEYRRVLEHTPNDSDIVLGLADVLTWQGKHADALAVLKYETSDVPTKAELAKRRARVLMALGRSEEARAEYRALLAIDSGNVEAKRALEDGPSPRTFELRIGSDTDWLNYADTANAQSVSLRARWNSRFTSALGGESYQRFGQDARKMRVGGTISLSGNDYLVVSGALANRQDVIARYEQAVEYGHVFRFSSGPVRGLEVSIEEKSLWFTTSRVTLIRTSAHFYLPRDWMWAASVTAARSSFDNAGHSWTPSGSTRLWFPLHSRVRGNILFAVGSENFSTVDQIGRFSAHTYGGGLRVSLSEYQDVSVFAAYQRRSQQRTQTSLGVSYGIRF